MLVNTLRPSAVSARAERVSVPASVILDVALESDRYLHSFSITPKPSVNPLLLKQINFGELLRRILFKNDIS